jgi:hypothetical protein
VSEKQKYNDFEYDEKIKEKSIHQPKDYYQKLLSLLAKDSAFMKFYGLDLPPVKESLNTELIIHNTSRMRADLIFLLEDDTVLNLEFQTKYAYEDLLRFRDYNIYLNKHEGRKVISLIVYSASTKAVPSELDTGSIVFKPLQVMLGEYIADDILSTLKSKITGDYNPNSEELLSLAYLTLMSSNMTQGELAKESIVIAQNIPDEETRNLATIAIFYLSEKFLDKNQQLIMEEELKMTESYKRLFGQAIEENVLQEKMNIAKNLLDMLDDETIAKKVGLEIEVVRNLRSENMHIS